MIGTTPVKGLWIALCTILGAHFPYEASKAIERYAVNPGQATAYLVGKLKIVELREKARAALGDQFDLRDFHDELLKDGPVPLFILEAKIDRWIEHRLESAP